jgi:maltoporin
LRSTVHILFILSFLIGCKNSKKDIQKLESGVYYLNYKLSGDTLFFQTNNPKNLIRNWNKTVWKITEDSIFQDDSRGLSYYFGKDKCSYSLNDNTLTVKYKSNIGEQNKLHNEKVINMDKYIVLKSDKDFLQLIEIADSNAMSSKIRSDIQIK